MVTRRPRSFSSTPGARFVSAVAVAVLGLVLRDRAGGALALSAPSPLRQYHFGAASPKKVSAADLRREDPSAPRSYVPDGLTAEQYSKLKSEELAARRGKDFGRWGPRFQAQGAPEVGWFNLPSLWTRGFDANDDGPTAEEAAGGRRRRGVVADRLRRHGPPYLLLLAASHLLFRSLAARRVASWRWTALRVVLPAVLPLAALKPLNVLAGAKEGRRTAWLRRHGAAKLASLLAALLSAAALALR